MGDSYQKLRKDNAELRERVEDLESKVKNRTFDVGTEETIRPSVDDEHNFDPIVLLTVEDDYPYFMFADASTYKPTMEEFYFYFSFNGMKGEFADLLHERDELVTRYAKSDYGKFREIVKKEWFPKWREKMIKFRWVLRNHRKYNRIDPKTYVTGPGGMDEFLGDAD